MLCVYFDKGCKCYDSIRIGCCIIILTQMFYSAGASYMFYNTQFKYEVLTKNT